MKRNPIIHAMHAVGHSIIENLFPQKRSCMFCGRFWYGSKLSAEICPQCLLQWRQLRQQAAICPICGSFDSGVPCQGPCADSQSHLPTQAGSLTAICAAAPYTGVYRQRVMAFKYNGQKQLAAPLAYFMAEAWSERGLWRQAAYNRGRLSLLTDAAFGRSQGSQSGYGRGSQGGYERGDLGGQVSYGRGSQGGQVSYGRGSQGGQVSYGRGSQGGQGGYDWGDLGSQGGYGRGSLGGYGRGGLGGQGGYGRGSQGGYGRGDLGRQGGYGRGKPCLVPVPMHREKESKRGYNQSRLLAEAVQRETGFPVEELLRRPRAGQMQAGLDKRQRQKALDQVFQWADGEDPRPGPAILVDDVVTTGATLESCGSILRERGYGPIWGLTFAGGSGLSMGNHNLPI